jgi:cytochrome P450
MMATKIMLGAPQLEQQPTPAGSMMSAQHVNVTLLAFTRAPQVETEDEEWTEDFVGERDPSILHFLLASGDQISSKQLRDDLMTLLIAGHEVRTLNP